MIDLPENFTAETRKYVGFYRCTIRNDMGRPVGLGEGETAEAAETRAMESFERNNRK